MRMARARDSLSNSDWGSMRIIRGASPKVYHANEQTGHAIIAKLLAVAATSSIVVQWIWSLYYAGNEYIHGESWISAILDGSPILAFIPKHGMLRCKGRVYWILHIYPHGIDTTYGLPKTAVRSDFKPKVMILEVSSPKLLCVRALWPSFREEKRGSVTFRFVPL